MEAPARDRELEPAYLETAVRAWAVRDVEVEEDGVPTGAQAARPRRRYPRHWLIFDTETTIDMTQRLLFGCWRLCTTDETDPHRPKLRCVEEGIFYPDDLVRWDSAGAGVIADLQRERASAIDLADVEIANRLLVVVGLREFLDRTLWRGAWKLRAGVVCFNSPFDLSRLAWHATAARTSKALGKVGRFDPYAGGFSFAVWERKQRIGAKRESRYRPRIAIKSIDSKRALKGFRAPFEVDAVDQIRGYGETAFEKDFRWHGEFLDLRTLTFALTDRGHTLESACDAFGVPYVKREVEHGQLTREYVEYCREDTLATQRLCEAALGEFMRHPVDLKASRAFSPATIGRSYLKTMGVKPPRRRQRWDPRFLGWSMSAYYGGRAECRIRRVPVPVVYCDFLSMYPTVCTLMGIWHQLTARQVKVVDATEEVREMLDALTLEDCLAPELWPGLVGIARIIPNGDVLPVRAQYGPSPNYQIGVNHLKTEEPSWYTLADLAASKILTGQTPKIERTYRLTPSQDAMVGLRAVQLLREVGVAPTQDDFFKASAPNTTIMCPPS